LEEKLKTNKLKKRKAKTSTKADKLKKPLKKLHLKKQSLSLDAFESQLSTSIIVKTKQISNKSF